MESIWQMKMRSGAELFADVFDWGDDTGEMGLKNPMAIHRMDTPSGAAYYTLRPYMTGQTIDQIVTINIEGVEGVTIPSDSLIEQYLITVKSMDDREAESESVEEEKIETVENIIKGVDFSKKPIH